MIGMLADAVKTINAIGLAVTPVALALIALFAKRVVNRVESKVNDVQTEVGTVHTEVGDVHNTAKDIKKDTHATDLAINNAEIGMPTIAQRVIDSDKRYLDDAAAAAARTEWQVSVLRLITDKLKIDAPPPPAVVGTVEIALPSGPDEITVPRLTNAEAVADQEPK